MTPTQAMLDRLRSRMPEAARQVTTSAPDDGGDHAPPGDPGTGDDAVRSATGRGWEEWRELLDAWAGRDDGHGAIAAHLQDEHGVEGWWAQTVTVGYERLSGRRLPHQRADGSFSAGRSGTLRVDAPALRELLLDETTRGELFGGLATELRSRPTSKTVRLAVGPGTAEIAMDERTDGRVKVTVQHEGLGEYTDVARWKAYWGAWLEALDETPTATASSVPSPQPD